MSTGRPDDAIPPNCAVLDVHVGQLRQLLNAMDPAPFRERDLDPRAEEYIVEWGKEVRPERSLALISIATSARSTRSVFFEKRSRRSSRLAR